MSDDSSILVSTLVERLAIALSMVVALAGCGQRGPLFLPTGEAAAGRASLPQVLGPAAPPAPAASSDSPTRTP